MLLSCDKPQSKLTNQYWRDTVLKIHNALVPCIPYSGVRKYQRRIMFNSTNKQFELYRTVITSADGNVRFNNSENRRVVCK